MKRHPFDLTSLLFGAVFGGAAAVYLFADQLAWDVDGRWVLPIALIVLGVAGIAGAVGGLRPSGGQADDAVTAAGADAEPHHAADDAERDLAGDAARTS